MTPRRILLIGIAFIMLLAGSSGFYTVSEGQQAIVLRLGKIVGLENNQAQITGPGLHPKWPFLDEARRFDMRLQTFSVSSTRILTKEQKYVLVDYFVKWRIANIPLYYTRTDGFALQAERLLEQKINDVLRAAFGRYSISDAVTGERGNIMLLLKEQANASAKSLGMDVIDVRIKRIDLPKEVSASVFNRMRTERGQVAMKHRSDGKAAAEAIRATADAKVTVLLATAQTESSRILAQGSLEAAAIYNQAYAKNTDFYALYKSLQAYRTVFANNKNNFFVLKPDSEFFKYFGSIGAK